MSRDMSLLNGACFFVAITFYKPDAPTALKFGTDRVSSLITPRLREDRARPEKNGATSPIR
jgi:hypothetical protein